MKMDKMLLVLVAGVVIMLFNKPLGMCVVVSAILFNNGILEPHKEMKELEEYMKNQEAIDEVEELIDNNVSQGCEEPVTNAEEENNDNDEVKANIGEVAMNTEESHEEEDEYI